MALSCEGAVGLMRDTGNTRISKPRLPLSSPAVHLGPALLPSGLSHTPIVQFLWKAVFGGGGARFHTAIGLLRRCCANGASTGLDARPTCTSGLAILLDLPNSMYWASSFIVISVDDNDEHEHWREINVGQRVGNKRIPWSMIEMVGLCWVCLWKSTPTNAVQLAERNVAGNH